MKQLGRRDTRELWIDASHLFRPARTWVRPSTRSRTEANKQLQWSHWLCSRNPAQSPHKNTDALWRARRGALGEQIPSRGQPLACVECLSAAGAEPRLGASGPERPTQFAERKEGLAWPE